MSNLSSDTYKTAPKGPGVYLFKKGTALLYIGKAARIKKRLASYFRVNASPKIQALRNEATMLEWIETESETEALIKESELIKQHLPPYNVLLRDDKNYFYVEITRDIFPRIFLTHQPEKNKKLQKNYIGPFTSGTALKMVVKLLRKLFPYCTCARPHTRPCLNSQIGRCPGYCCMQGQEIDETRQNLYRQNIKNVVTILQGKKQRLLSELSKEMRLASKQNKYEYAGHLRDQIAGLENIFSHNVSPTLPRVSLIWHKTEKNIKTILNTKNHISRVEGYDISNISGTEATGSMVVFIDGIPAKSEYRKFKIKTVHQPSDVDMLKEVLSRRLAHTDWNTPDLLLIDGGRPQLNAVAEVISQSKIQTPPLLTSLAKREEELYTERKKPIRISTLPPNTAHFFQHVRDESHRFAKKYHHKLRKIAFQNAK